MINAVDIDYLSDKPDEENASTIVNKNMTAQFYTPRTQSPNLDKIVTNEDDSYSHTSNTYWWFNNTGNASPNVSKAWNYSQGEDITVAILDQNFGVIEKYDDFKNRVIFKPEFLKNYKYGFENYCQQALTQDPGTMKDNNDKYIFSADVNGINYDESVYRNNCYDNHMINSNSNYLVNLPNHGYNIASLIASQADDMKRSVGLSPKVKILPITTGGDVVVQYSKAAHYLLAGLVRISDYIQQNGAKSISVVNISAGVRINDAYFTENNNSAVYFTKNGSTYYNLKLKWVQDYTKYLTDTLKVIIVTTAGNENNNASGTLANIPALCDNTIVVGAYQQAANNKIKRSLFSNIGTGNTGSNYGYIVDLWAPGSGIFNFVPTGQINNWSYNSVSGIEGTSFAAPLVTSTIALMKSWNKDLSWNNALQILKDNGYSVTNSTISDMSFNVPAGKNQKAINVYNTIIDSRVGALKYVQLTGIYNSDNSITVTSSPVSTSSTVIPTFDYRQVYSDMIGKNVKVLGWLASKRLNFANNLSLNPENIEILQMRVN